MEKVSDIDRPSRKLTSAMLQGGPSPLEQLPALGHVFEQLAANVSTSLEGFFAKRAVASAQGTARATTFESLLQSQGRLAAVLRCGDAGGRLALIFASDVADFAVASAFKAGRAPTARGARAVTTIDKFFVREFANRLAKAFSAAFAESTGATLAFEELLTLADASLFGRRNMAAVAARFEVESARRSTSFTALLPQNLLQAFRRELSIRPAAAPAAVDQRWVKQLEAGVSSARMPVTVVLETLKMTLGDVANLSVGQVLSLRGSARGRLRLECGGRTVFWGRLSEGAGRYLVEVETPVTDDEEIALGRSP